MYTAIQNWKKKCVNEQANESNWSIAVCFKALLILFFSLCFSVLHALSDGWRALGNGFNIQNVYHLLTNDPNKWQKVQKRNNNVSSLQTALFSSCFPLLMHISHINWFQSNNKCLQAFVNATQNIPNSLVIAFFIIFPLSFLRSPLCNANDTFFPIFSDFYSDSLRIWCFYNELIAARVFYFPNQNVDKHTKRNAETFVHTLTHKKAMLIIFAFCFLVMFRFPFN